MQSTTASATWELGVEQTGVTSPASYWIGIGKNCTLECGGRNCGSEQPDPNAFGECKYEPFGGTSLAYRHTGVVCGVVDLVINGRGRTAHPIHIHVNHFQLISVYDSSGKDHPDLKDGGWGAVGDWRDTIPAWAGRTTVRYALDHYGGAVMVHCHFLTHEDMGMMARFWVNNSESASACVTSGGGDTGTSFTTCTDVPSDAYIASPPSYTRTCGATTTGATTSTAAATTGADSTAGDASTAAESTGSTATAADSTAAASTAAGSTDSTATAADSTAADATTASIASTAAATTVAGATTVATTIATTAATTAADVEVKAVLSLSNVTAATLNQTSFRVGVASTASVTMDKVVINSVTDETSRRATTSVAVDFSVFAAAAAASAIATSVSDTTAVQAALVSAGVQTAGVVVRTAPTTIVPTQAPAGTPTPLADASRVVANVLLLLTVLISLLTTL